ncbi:MULTISPECIES: hypothetical protein [Burkholderia]|uniref:hypothetical protein n=2 Tax=Burkholderiaceae TaxID=119060 RepID=UPI0015A6CFDF|nr:MULTISPECIES: hypothetical protein [Burkholderia]
MDGIQQRFFICVHGFPPMVHRPAQLPYSALAFAPRLFRASPRPPFFSFLAIRSQMARCDAQAVRAYPVGVRETRPLHLAFADRAVGKIGRQFSYKHNAEEGVRLDEQRRTMDRGRKGGWRRSFVIECASVLPGLSEPSCGRYARSCAIRRHGAFAGRCARTRFGMNRRFSDLSPPPRVAGPSPAGGPSGNRCARIDRALAPAFLRLLHPDDTAAAHRGGRTNVSAAMYAHAHAPRRRDPARVAAFHGKTSVGAARRDS